jgi:hypothetical protein
MQSARCPLVSSAPNCAKARVPTPILCDAGASSSLLSPFDNVEGDGAPDGATSSIAAWWRRASGERLAPAGAPSAAISVSEPRFLGRGLAGVTRGCGSPCPSPAKAPRRRVLVPAGRGPGASRERACEARPRAPHQPRAFALWPPEAGAVVGAQSLRTVPLSRTPHDSALRRTGRIVYSPSRNICQVSILMVRSRAAASRTMRPGMGPPLVRDAPFGRSSP